MIEKRKIFNEVHGNVSVPEIGSEQFEKIFPIVDIESISMNDEFMQYEPENMEEARVKTSIITAKQIGMRNFRIAAMDPSFADDGETIIYCPGKKVAVGKSPLWWYKNAPCYMPEKNSKICDDLEYDIFLGVMQIKDLVENGCKVKEAWKRVCTDVLKTFEIEESTFELTGTRLFGRCYDLANTAKLVKKRDALLFLYLGGHSNSFGGFDFPLAVADYIESPYSSEDFDDAVGVIRLDI